MAAVFVLPIGPRWTPSTWRYYGLYLFFCGVSPPSPSYCCTNTNTNTLKCLNWLPLAGRRLSHRCTAVENAIKGDIPQHFESFKSTLRSSHGYNTRHGYLPRLPKPKTEWGKRVSYSRFVNDWMSLPVFLRKPMPCTIFKKNLTRFLMDKHF